MRRPAALIVLIIAALLGALAAKSWLVPLPSVRKSSAQSEFNVHRAQARLTDLIGEAIPHPADTAANDTVRDRLVGHLATMGLKPQVRDVMACNALEKARGVSCARVRNVVATIGPSAGRHLLLNAHYDSSPAGPGACCSPTSRWGSIRPRRSPVSPRTSTGRSSSWNPGGAS